MTIYAKFPAKNCSISQTAGVYYNEETKNSSGLYDDNIESESVNNISTSVSHYGNRANDIIPDDGRFLAPCAIECVFHERKSDSAPGSLCAVISIFNSKEIVKCADGTESYLSFMCVHGGDEVQTCKDHHLRVGDEFEQGQWFYTMGTDFGLDADGNQKTCGAHVHFQVKKGLHSGLSSDIPVRYGAYTFVDDCFIPDILFNNDTTISWIGNPDEWCFDYPLTSPGSLETPFIPIGKLNGWHTYNGEIYYVKNETVLKGWQLLPEKNTLMNYYYYFDSEGKMQTYKFIASGSNWYFVDEDGKMLENAWITYPAASGQMYYFGNDGIMTHTSWLFLDNEWYYFNESGLMLTGWFLDTNQAYYFLNDGRFSDKPRGAMMRNKWVASGNDWYYVKDGGVMAYDADNPLTIDGVDYYFSETGLCLNPNGEDIDI